MTSMTACSLHYNHTWHDGRRNEHVIVGDASRVSSVLDSCPSSFRPEERRLGPNATRPFARTGGLARLTEYRVRY
eukprot:scaffold27484_cov120-Isochrysis_galbana.AAC.5